MGLLSHWEASELIIYVWAENQRISKVAVTPPLL